VPIAEIAERAWLIQYELSDVLCSRRHVPSADAGHVVPLAGRDVYLDHLRGAVFSDEHHGETARVPVSHLADGGEHVDQVIPASIDPPLHLVRIARGAATRCGGGPRAVGGRFGRLTPGHRLHYAVVPVAKIQPIEVEVRSNHRLGLVCSNEPPSPVGSRSRLVYI